MSILITADFKAYYWAARCHAPEGLFETERRSHGSARQAADEILLKLQYLPAYAGAKLRRTHPKVYEVVLLTPVAEGGAR